MEVIQPFPAGISFSFERANDGLMLLECFFVQTLLFLLKLLRPEIRGNAYANPSRNRNRSRQDEYACGHPTAHYGSRRRKRRRHSSSREANSAQTVECGKRAYAARSCTKSASDYFGNGAVPNGTIRIIERSCCIIYHIDHGLQRVETLEVHGLLFFSRFFYSADALGCSTNRVIGGFANCFSCLSGRIRNLRCELLCAIHDSTCGPLDGIASNTQAFL